MQVRVPGGDVTREGEKERGEGGKEGGRDACRSISFSSS